jgi:hypothetical protein
METWECHKPEPRGQRKGELGQEASEGKVDSERMRKRNSVQEKKEGGERFPGKPPSH